MLPQPRDESRFGLCPLSLAATHGINVFFFSSGYLDVSVPWVRSIPAMNSPAGEWELPHTSFLIRRSPDQRSFASFPEHIAGYHVLHRLSMPRHPPYTLSSLTTFIDHRHSGRAMTSSPAKTPVTRSITDRSPKRCSTTSARQKDQSSGGGSTLAGAGIAEDHLTSIR